MSKQRDESLDETAARLGLGSEPVPKVPLLSNRAPGSGGDHLASPGSSRGRGAVIGIVVAVIAAVVLGAIVVGVVTKNDGGTPFSAGPSWSEYPGTDLYDSDEILAAPSLEDVQERADSFTAALKEKLAVDYDLLWQQEYEGDLSIAGNGYDGDSMLYNYSSPDWLGAAVAHDDSAREDVIAAFQELSKEFGAEDFYIANDLYTEPDDKESAISQFGSATRSKQALWSASADVYGLGGLRMNLDVLDSSIPTDDEFSGGYYVRVIELADGDATLFITLRLSSYSLLSEKDREEFTERIGSYDEKNKP